MAGAAAAAQTQPLGGSPYGKLLHGTARSIARGVVCLFVRVASGALCSNKINTNGVKLFVRWLLEGGREGGRGHAASVSVASLRNELILKRQRVMEQTSWKTVLLCIRSPTLPKAFTLLSVLLFWLYVLCQAP